ncbi:MAG: TRAP transporter small permease [Alphaproteobacteria bacterium]|nr:TRAP transporter small permease [Alphaproteobacteria bacterium]
MDSFIDSIRRLSQTCGIVAALLIAAAVVVVCEMVVIRYFLRASTVWQTEFVTYSLIGATFIGSPYVALIRGHVNVELLPVYLGGRARLALGLFCAAAAFGLSVVLAWTGFGLLAEAWVGGWRTDTIWALPLWIPYLALPVGMALMALQYAAEILCLATGRSQPFGLSEDRD